MGKLIYAFNTSVDGWTVDASGALDWAPPEDDVFAAITELMASAGTYLYGRALYESMAVWETDPSLGERTAATRTFADAWQAAEKVVYSSTLTATATKRTRLEQHFDPAAVQDMKVASSRDLLVGGPNLAGQAIDAGLVDECQLYVWPIVLRGGKAALPTGARVDLDLVDVHRFSSGVLRLTYRPLPPG